jgi:hypothetical protein
MTADPRARLATRQAELIRALYQGPPAPGVDVRMVALTSMALADKRARSVAKVWPALARALGADFAGRFAAYARATPPPDGGALADGLAFSRVAARQQCLPDDARIERLLATTRVKLRRNRLTARRGPWLAATTTGRPRRVVIIVSLPPIGVHLVTLGPPPRTRLSRPRRRRPDGPQAPRTP